MRWISTILRPSILGLFLEIYNKKSERALRDEIRLKGRINFPS